jgi:hypothetical protein
MNDLSAKKATADLRHGGFSTSAPVAAATFAQDDNATFSLPRASLRVD